MKIKYISKVLLKIVVMATSPSLFGVVLYSIDTNTSCPVQNKIWLFRAVQWI